MHPSGALGGPKAENGRSGGLVLRNCYSVLGGGGVKYVCVRSSKNGRIGRTAACDPSAHTPLTTNA
jgi:hypothetical protein